MRVDIFTTYAPAGMLVDFCPLDSATAIWGDDYSLGVNSYSGNPIWDSCPETDVAEAALVIGY